MDNPAVREEVKSILRFWLDMGVDGFREDVVNFISKEEGLPDGLPFIPAINGMPHYKDGPHILEYMAEFRSVCREYDCFQLGEGPLTNISSALKYLTGPAKSLDMMFSFDHMMADCLFIEYIHLPFSLTKFKKAVTKWQKALEGKAWNALYLENHDHPRIISRYGSERLFWRESGTMLAACYLFLQGTPFVYQGQEIGMTNIRLLSIDQYVDVSSIMNFHTYFKNAPMEKRMELIHHSSRDSARTPMQWSGEENAGFSEGKPWFFVNPNYPKINVAAEEEDKNSILHFYRRCLALRKHSKTLTYGTYREYFPRNKHLYIYERVLGEVHYLIICSFSHLPLRCPIPKSYVGKKGQLVLCNYPEEEREGAEKLKQKARQLAEQIVTERGMLRPYEARVYRFRM